MQDGDNSIFTSGVDTSNLTIAPSSTASVGIRMMPTILQLFGEIQINKDLNKTTGEFGINTLSLAAPAGYTYTVYSLPNNFKIKYGTLPDLGFDTVTYNTADLLPFISNPMVFVQKQNASGGDSASNATVVYTNTLTGFTFDSSFGSTNKSAVYWVAFGQ